MTPLEVWGGVECTVNRLGDRWLDQLARSGHDRRLDDLDRFARLGIRALRYPILWERLAPYSLDAIDWRWSDGRMRRLRRLGIRPIVGLVHHGSGPRYTSLLDPGFPDLLARFARLVAARYPWVTDFTPVNEPLTTARFSGLYGHWYPHRRDDRTFVHALLTQLRGVARAMRAVREVTPAARLVQTEDCGACYGTPGTARQVQFEQHRRWLTWDVLSGRVAAAHPLYDWLIGAGASAADLQAFADDPVAPDVLGLNYYLTSDRYLDEDLARYPPALHGGNGVQAYADADAVRARSEGIAGHEAHIAAAWDRYRIPIAVTEVHLACTREEQIRWLAECARAAHAARARGIEVRAITPWALLGAYDWNSLVTIDAGSYEPGAYDVRSTPPRPTAVAGAIRALAAGLEPDHPAAAGPGWWRRAERFSYGPIARRDPATTAGPSILIVGATGTLGRAFDRICLRRGLRARLVGRREMDIADPVAVDAMIRRVEPWAVINAAGYVRVDAAEHDAERCWRENVWGPVNLAAACRRRNVKLVTFSSDLVFDGRAPRPYTEADTPNPLNVYGRTKAEAERRVLDLLGEALVIRSSAFFGPWDEHNYLAWLVRTLDAGEGFDAPCDTVVSPTYVPHLVDAALDLTIDGEHGIWHLANNGAVTWFEFAQQALAACGRAANGIRAAETSAVWRPAPRPPFSALASARGQLMPSLAEALECWARDRADLAAGRDTPVCATRSTSAS
jgi:dTDP-4-dehydrorhamnose reductase